MWTDWTQTDLPCLFSAGRASENAAFLTEILGPRFVRERAKSPTNPFLAQWHTTGGGAFLEINALAEDLRLISGKLGIDRVLSDFRVDELCLPTWHMIHSAALFERASAGSVLEFLDSANDEAPDFVVLVQGRRVPVEAKLLMKSEDEVRFQTFAERIVEALVPFRKESLIPPDTSVCVIAKRPIKSDISTEALDFCQARLRAYAGARRDRGRGNVCNVFVEPLPPERNVTQRRVIYIMAPVPDDENLRVLGRAKKASSQLKKFPAPNSAGIVCIGLNSNQDGRVVFEHFDRRFKSGQFSGISAVLLSKRGTHLAPPQRSVIDLLEMRGNPNSDQVVAESVDLKSLGMSAILTDTEPQIGGVRAYRMFDALAKFNGQGNAGIFVPDRRVLTPFMLA